jgi:hypothetical protein
MHKVIKVLVSIMVVANICSSYAVADNVVITKVSGISQNVSGTLLVEQPATINCSEAPSPATGKTHCDFSIRTKLESGSLNTVINITPVDQNGVALGYTDMSIMYPDANWKSMHVSVTVDANTKLSFQIKDSAVLSNTSVQQAFSSIALTGANKKPFSLSPTFPASVKTFKGENVNLGNAEFPEAIKTAIEAVDMGWGTAIEKGFPVMLFSYPTSMKTFKKCGTIPFQAVALDPSNLQPILTRYAIFKVQIWSTSGQLLSSGSLGSASTPWSSVTQVSTLNISFCAKVPQDSKSVKLIITAGQSLLGQYLIREYRNTVVFK